MNLAPCDAGTESNSNEEVMSTFVKKCHAPLGWIQGTRLGSIPVVVLLLGAVLGAIMDCYSVVE